MNLIQRLRDLSCNLYWTWHPELVEIFRDIDPKLWRQCNHNPVAFLDHLTEEQIIEKSSGIALEARISQAFHQMQDYLEEIDTWGNRHAGALYAKPVVYFSAEFGLHESLPLYSGGLGVLSGDHLKSASDLGVPLVGVGLFYAEGYFSQRLDENGWQWEDYNVTDTGKLPVGRATGEDGNDLMVSVQTRESTIHARVWTAWVGRSRLLLLDSNVPENSEEDRALTSQLYGGDRRTRIRQELLLGVGGYRTVRMLGICPGAIHLNEGHSAFSVLEATRELMERDQLDFAEATEHIATQTIFTTHTPVPAGHDRFDAGLVEQTLGPLREQLRLGEQDFMAMGRVNGEDTEEPFCMTVLGLRMSSIRNGVSARHGRVSRSMWQNVWPNLPTEMVPIGHITNGVHVDSWLAVPMAPIYDRYLGQDWQKQMHESDLWAQIERVDDAELWEQHQILNAHLIDYVHRQLSNQAEKRGGQEQDLPHLSPHALTIGFARRVALYKRTDMIFSDLDRLDRIVNHPDMPVQIIFAGKAHPGNDEGKRVIQKIFRYMLDDRFRGKIVFLEDYDMNVARHLVQGADVWLNNPRRPFEACGTSGQKVTLNGGLNLSVPDGWWAEAYDGSNGFSIGCGSESSDAEQQYHRDAENLYKTLEEEVIPLFYDRDEEGVPLGWIRRMKNAIRSLPWRFSARRMVRDYTIRCYLPAAGAATCSITKE
ncbi:MAG: alpha-glucan family phosphorylase [Phycisphaerae bacterium]